MKTNHFFISILLLLFCSSCKDKEDFSLREPFIGKWELIALGSEEDKIYPMGGELDYLAMNCVLEFFPDGILHTYCCSPLYSRDFAYTCDSENEIFDINTFRIDSKYLYFNYENRNTPPNSWKRSRYDYKYVFIGDRLQLTLIRGRIFFIGGHPKLFIYQRIE